MSWVCRSYHEKSAKDDSCDQAPLSLNTYTVFVGGQTTERVADASFQYLWQALLCLQIVFIFLGVAVRDTGHVLCHCNEVQKQRLFLLHRLCQPSFWCVVLLPRKALSNHAVTQQKKKKKIVHASASQQV